MKIWRQGDVVFQLIEKGRKLSRQSLLAESGDIVEFRSETGKSHTIQLSKGSMALQVKSEDQETLLTLVEPTTVQHSEHAQITLPAGQYRAFRIRDYPQRMQGEYQGQPVHGD
jgi:hypothetical protein